MINELINLANQLDQRGLQKEADYLDSLITKIANPEEEMSGLQPYPAPLTEGDGFVDTWGWPKERAEEFYGHAIDSLGLRPWWVEVVAGGFYIHWMFKKEVIEENPNAIKSFLEYVGFDVTKKFEDGEYKWKNYGVTSNDGSAIGWSAGGP